MRNNYLSLTYQIRRSIERIRIIKSIMLNKDIKYYKHYLIIDGVCYNNWSERDVNKIRKVVKKLND